ncbi:hypothetical protein [Rhizobium sp. NXC24]|uniref:hypothetical protein n=1 Tax=Rhizobium sp. NXC24 TaxID=2048897 RepID=UPI000CDF3865|nr:hypothetical protein [Rhizobium sp. NXC24]AVA23908.1 hypothetical protein NXC24_PA00265 [Rhizobium sp. NXC24]
MRLDAATFVQPGYEAAPGDWSDTDRRAIASLRGFYPEIAHWGDLAIGVAFGELSQEVLDVSWADWMLDQRDEIFLNYCCWRQTRGQWDGGLDAEALAQANEWKKMAE